MTSTRPLKNLALIQCSVLGAAGFPLSPGDEIDIEFNENIVNCQHKTHSMQFSLIELENISISGPGTVVTGGGIIGGGFGVSGALQGMMFAGVLNALLTKKKIHTLIALTTNFGELHLHYDSMEPGALRIYLCEVFSRLRNLNSNWRDSRLRIIEDQLTAGSITAEEAESMKSKLVSPPESFKWRSLGIGVTKSPYNKN
ncbi:hypothetical protein H0A65_04625 [Alcaligenaceae bacterium]|nr:hypothetical protein [Alcaligenaceae bacterium]